MAITFCSLDSNKQVNSVNENSSGVKESTKLERANLEEKPDVAEFSKKEDKKDKKDTDDSVVDAEYEEK